MREGQFIKRNIDRWEGYKEPTRNADEVAKRFTYLVDDLSYAKTFYPNSNTIKYINSLAAGIYLSIYKNKKESRSRFFTFFGSELPLIIHKYHKQLLITFLFFLVFIFVGAFSAYMDPSIIRSVLSDGYVDTTEHNIASGNPFGIYKDMAPFPMFLYIAFHNISVTFLCYVVGLTGGILTIYMLFNNGVMVGAFEAMFFQHHLGVKSLLVILTHGTLELSACVISSCAGIILGSSLLFPKTYTRLQSFKMGAKDSMKITVSLVPIFIVAAFFESYVTRHTEMPLILSLCILGASAAFIVWYFIIFPIKVKRRTANDPEEVS